MSKLLGGPWAVWEEANVLFFSPPPPRAIIPDACPLATFENLDGLYARAESVVIGYPWFYLYFFSTKILKYSGFVFFAVFIRLVYCSDYLRPEHRYLEKVSAKNSSSSPKQSLAKLTPNEDLIICISYRLGFLDPYNCL